MTVHPSSLASRKQPVDEHEASLLARVRAGDQRAVGLMLKRYDRWSSWYTSRILKQNKTFWCYYEDVAQEVRIAMIDAMCKFDPDLGGSLTSWMCKVVGSRVHQILFMFIGTNVTLRTNFTQELVRSTHTIREGLWELDEVVERHNVMVDLDEVWDEVECYLVHDDDVDDVLGSALSTSAMELVSSSTLDQLSERNRAVVRDVYFGTFTTYDDVAARYTISRERVRQICLSYTSRIRAKLQELGHIELDSAQNTLVETSHKEPYLCVCCRRCGASVGNKCQTIQSTYSMRDLDVPLQIPHAERRIDARSHLRAIGHTLTERSAMFGRPRRDSANVDS